MPSRSGANAPIAEKVNRKTPRQWGKTPPLPASADRVPPSGIHLRLSLTQPSRESYTYAVGGFDLACTREFPL